MTPEELAVRLDDEALWADPPAGGLEALLETIAAERTEPEPAPVVPLARRRFARRVAAGVLAVAAAALLAVVLIRPDGGTQIPLTATGRAPGASATAVVRDTDTGLSITLDIRDLPTPPPGSYYQAWLKGPKGTVAIGTFHARHGTGEIRLWAGVALADYPTLTVTLEPEDGDPASSGVLVLSGRAR